MPWSLAAGTSMSSPSWFPPATSKKRSAPSAPSTTSRRSSALSPTPAMCPLPAGNWAPTGCRESGSSTFSCPSGLLPTTTSGPAAIAPKKSGSSYWARAAPVSGSRRVTTPPPTTALVISRSGPAVSPIQTWACGSPSGSTVPASRSSADNGPSKGQTFVTWEAADGGLKVRFLVPVNVYPPGCTGTTPPPQDYLAYLRAQSDHGGHFTDVTETTIGGHPATILTATTDTSLDGSLG